MVEGIGPFLGAILAVLFYKLIKKLEYEVGNPGSDENKAGKDELDDDSAPDAAARATQEQMQHAPGSRRSGEATRTSIHSTRNGANAAAAKVETDRARPSSNRSNRVREYDRDSGRDRNLHHSRGQSGESTQPSQHYQNPYSAGPGIEDGRY